MICSKNPATTSETLGVGGTHLVCDIAQCLQENMKIISRSMGHSPEIGGRQNEKTDIPVSIVKGHPSSVSEVTWASLHTVSTCHRNSDRCKIRNEGLLKIYQWYELQLKATLRLRHHGGYNQGQPSIDFVHSDSWTGAERAFGKGRDSTWCYWALSHFHVTEFFSFSFTR